MISVTEPRKAFQYFFGNSIENREGDHVMVHPKQDAAGLPTRAKHDEIVELTDKDLAEVAAGKTVSWAYDDEAPAPSISSVIGCLVRAVVAGTGM